MAGWSSLTNGAGLDGGMIVDDYESNGCCLDTDHDVKVGVHDSDDYKVKLRCLFDQVLSIYLDEVASKGCIRPIPAMLGDGRSIDLFKLFWVVRERGGFDRVSQNRLWSFVVQELGLDLKFSAAIKLIYTKYLSELEKWLMGNAGCDFGGNFRFLSLELDTEFRGLLKKWPIKKIKDDKLARLKYKKDGKYVDMDIEKNELDMLETKNMHAIQNGVGKRYGDEDDDKRFHDNDDKLCNNDHPTVTQKEFTNHKRKRESLSEMFNWIVQVAKHHDDPSIASVLEPRRQAMRARKALLKRKDVDSNIKQSPLQNGQKMHPSMYKDITAVSRQSTERSRCSERVPTAIKSRYCPCCSTCSATENKLKSPRKRELETGPKEKTPKRELETGPKEKTPKRELETGPKEKTPMTASTNTTVGPVEDKPPEKHVAVGPLFQAIVPEWTGAVYESDSKWLGTQVWPLKVKWEQNPIVERNPIGMGRPDSCGCELPGSVECVRYHIAEKRYKLKLELGSVFFHWGFDRMGEEVSLRWTVGEEQRFIELLKANAERFWYNASKWFRWKTREDLVSYYFNVVLIKRRSYQNRVTPRNINSDDESEFGSISGNFGDVAVKVPGSNMLICSQNKQCLDLE